MTHAAVSPVTTHVLPVLLLEGAALIALGRLEELDSLRASLLFWDTPEVLQDLPLAWPVTWSQELLAHGHETAARELLEETMELYRAMPLDMRAQLPKRWEYIRMLWLAGRYAEAADSLAPLVERNPGYPNLRLRHAMAAGRSGDAETALRELDRLLEMDSPLKLYWRFCVLASLGRHEEALAILRAYPFIRFHNWPGNHTDYAYPLMREYPAYLDQLAPRDGPGEDEPG